MTLLTDQGQPLHRAGVPVTHPYLYHDTFTGPDGSLPAGWVNGHDYDATYCPLGIKSNQLAAVDPFNNDNTTGTPPYDGIGCIWRDTGVVDVEATIRVAPMLGHWRECSPLLHVTPGTHRHGVGAWLSTFIAQPNGWLLVGYIANPATDFGTGSHALAVGSFTRTASSRLLTLRSVGGMLRVYLDGSPMQLNVVAAGDEGIPLGATYEFPIHASLTASTLHGIAIDTHLEHPDPVERPQADGEFDAPMIDEVWLSAIAA